MIDLKKVSPKWETPLEEYCFPRNSSKYRILINTGALGIFGYFSGMGIALHKNQNRFYVPILYCLGITLGGFTHQIMNEIYTGMAIRNKKRDQYWGTNTAAGIINCGLIYSILCLRKPTYQKFIMAQYAAGSICIVSMILDLCSHLERKSLLKL